MQYIVSQIALSLALSLEHHTYSDLINTPQASWKLNLTNDLTQPTLDFEHVSIYVSEDLLARIILHILYHYYSTPKERSFIYFN